VAAAALGGGGGAFYALTGADLAGRDA
jgi:hypothetical protein